MMQEEETLAMISCDPMKIETRNGVSRLGAMTAGFTLLEMVMVIAVLGIIAGVGAPVMLAGYRAYFLGSDVQQLDTTGRMAMERILRELREADNATLSVGSGSSITFKDKSGTTLSFSYSSATKTLKRNTDTLAGNVSGMVFKVIAGTLKTVEVTMTLSASAQNLVLYAKVTPRN
ncbi:MAG: prepilin-type N-terminal cleavage/methylation domain-containing protein [Magnetococcales bacterium]|nr:prepilin-type N-terminal cleavage/methylation domain-containing protein [Magnetococcales bacterium]MBF0419939.1 prepilin-type N-terminal cleavage/methylation domain-containing protein [Magnetococcales bacterium]